jgi:hypothetical protein
MEIKKNGSQPSGKGPADYFTGTVRMDPLFKPPEPVCESKYGDDAYRHSGQLDGKVGRVDGKVSDEQYAG